jgi:glycosyltransferase involved in cell wall biosynthesis
MDVSVVICTRNRAIPLAETLLRWLDVKAPFSWELVLVNNNATDNTAQVIEDFRQHFPQRLIYYLETALGLGAARDRGWRLAQGELVVFTDDDCYPAPDYLLTMHQCFIEDPQLGFVGGRVLLYDPTDYPITIQEFPTRCYFPPRSFLEPGFIQGANFACRRQALADIDGFDHRLGAGTRFPVEDADVLARLSAAGWHGIYDPRPVVYHHHRRKTAQEVAHLREQYDWGRGAYYIKCLQDPRIRWIYLKNWLLRIPGQKPRHILTELRSAFHFWWQYNHS